MTVEKKTQHTLLASKLFTSINFTSKTTTNYSPTCKTSYYCLLDVYCVNVSTYLYRYIHVFMRGLQLLQLEWFTQATTVQMNRTEEMFNEYTVTHWETSQQSSLNLSNRQIKQSFLDLLKSGFDYFVENL